ncbi:MAG: ACP S-malonyltransferase [Clostridia bacterium]|nr:ACP S-malonyltransferase [Clostridia bacterium]
MRNTAFLFSGQGAQYVGMARDVCQGYPEAAAVFALADDVLGRSISAVAFAGPEEALNQTENTQPAVFACEIALLRVLEKRGAQAAVCAGFSLGEWAALVAAGVLSFEDALLLVQKRAYIMQTAVPLGEGGMAVVLGKSDAEVEALCKRAGEVTPSNYNCPGQITVAGRSAGIEALLSIAEQEGIAAKRLAVSVPSHCPMMQDAADALAAAIADTPFLDARIPVVMNCTARAESSGAQIKKNVIAQLTHPVLFQRSTETMLGMGITDFVEIGPGKTLCGLVKKTAKLTDADVRLFRSDSLDAITTWEAAYAE